MDLFLPIAGAVLVGAVTLDVFFTVLFPASRHGPIRKPLGKVIWHSFRFVAGLLQGQRRRNVLSYSGPTVVTATIAIWFALMVWGWAMIYKPALGTAILASSGLTDTSWSAALYFSGFTATTLGVGDLVPATAPYRLMTVVEAAGGFAFFSMAITYFLSVYSNLPKRNAFALGLHHLTGKTDDAAELLARLADGEDLSEARQHLSSKADFLRQTAQAHRFYPVLRYFHYREAHLSLARVLLTALDTATLIRSALDPERYQRLLESLELEELFDAAVALMEELVPGAGSAPPSPELARAWRARYHGAVERLAEAGLAVCPHADVGADAYVELRADWDPQIRELAEATLYEWSDIEGSPAPEG